MGYPAFKIHGWTADTPLQQQVEVVRTVGRRVGGKMILTIDPACELMTFGDALQVGWACDEYRYLWWEDPFEDKGDQDDTFAWTWQDYVAMPYSFGRFLLNTIAWPVSAVVTPPWASMVSDGNVGRDHDATVGTSPDPTAGPSDFGYPDVGPLQEVADSAN